MLGCLRRVLWKVHKQPEDTQSINMGEDKQVDRGTWGSPVEFILSCLGYAVGLGNVWRFPYLTYENGGGAFLIPYVIMLVFVGLPVFFIELAVGQYGSGGPVTVWELSPLFQGVGFGMLIISFIGCIYYNMIIAWSLYYMFASWQKVLPWSTCTNDFNTENCYSKIEATDCESYDDTLYFNNTCYNLTLLANQTFDICPTTLASESDTCGDTLEHFINLTLKNRVSPSEEYFNNEVLDRSDRMEEAGYMKWDLTLCLLLAWILNFFCVIKGIKSSGKVVYFTATFPYLIIIILLIRGALLEGALEGIKFYIIPKWEKLATAKVWADAAGQIFFSLSVGFGGLMTFASYNKFNNNIYRDTLIVTIGNCLTSFVAGFAIFSILGHLGYVLNKEVKDVARSGSGLAFVAYPEVVLYLEPPQLWATLFFFMLLTLGLDSQFAGIENIMTAIVDTKPSLRPHKTWIALVLCIVMFIMGLSMCTRSGIYWLDLMGYYSSGWALILIALAECGVVAWVYGARRLMNDIETMVGFKLYMHWWVCWTIISPVLIVAILIFNFIDFTPLKYGDYVMPDWAQALGWLMALAPILVIPLVAVIKIVKARTQSGYEGLSLQERIVKLTKSTEKWDSVREASGEPPADKYAYKPDDSQLAAYANQAMENDTKF